LAIKGADRALMAQAKIVEEWPKRAKEYLVRYVDTHFPGGAQFSPEMMRSWAYKKGLPVAAENRAWGNIFRYAAEDGLIEQVGFGKMAAKDCHDSDTRMYVGRPEKIEAYVKRWGLF